MADLSITGILVAFGVTLAVVLVVLMAATVAYAFYRRVGEDRTTERRAAIRERILDVAADDDPDWDAWRRDLSGDDRAIARTVIERLLRTVEGETNDRLGDAARSLNVEKTAITDLESGNRVERLRALSWLVLLGEPVPPEDLRRYCTRDPDLRASAARLVVATRPAQAPTEAVDLLVDGTTESMTAFGLDTLYRVGLGRPDDTITAMGAKADAVTSTQLVQFCFVTGELGRTSKEVDPASLSWVVDRLDDPNDAVRETAVEAVTGFRRYEAVRDAVDLDALLADEAVAVRRAAVEMVGEAPTPGDMDVLEDTLPGESDDHVRLAALGVLAENDVDPDLPPGGWLADAWNWVRADRRQRRVVRA